MANFVHRFFLAPACVKPVGSIEHQTGNLADVTVRVNDPRRNPGSGWIGGPNSDHSPMASGGTSRSSVPEVQAKVGWPDKRETIRLIDMLVGTARHSWKS